MRPISLNFVFWIAALPLFGQNYTISTFAGGGMPNHIPGTSAGLVGAPQALASDSAGNLFFLYQNSVLRLDAKTNMLTAAAGNGIAGFSGDTGPAVNAQLNSPLAIAVDSHGNLYIADCLNRRVREVSGGTITTVAGSGAYGFGGDNGPATSAQLSCPSGVAVDSTGNLYIADRSNYIRKVAGGIITTIAGNGAPGFSGDNGPAVTAQLNYPTGLAVNTADQLLIADSGNNRVREVANGIITTVAGDGTPGFSGDKGPGSLAQLNYPTAVAMDSLGNLFIADTLNNRIRVVASGAINTLAGSGAAGFIDNAPAALAAFNGPDGVALDPMGNLYVADPGNFRIREVSNGAVTTVAGGGSNFGDGFSAAAAWLSNPVAVALDSAGDVYIADANLVREVTNGVIGTAAGNGTAGFSGDNSQATGAELNAPQAVAADPANNLYIGDNNRVREVINGVIATIAGGGTRSTGSAPGVQLGVPQGLAIDSATEVFIAESSNIVQELVQGVVSTVAGAGAAGYSGDNGPAINARLNNPHGVAVDSAGKNLYIADTGNHRIRKVTISSGTITTVAGAGTSGFSGDNGYATAAQLSSPTGVALDTSGNLYILDNHGSLVRKVVNGIITTIAGGANQFADNVPAMDSSLANASGIAVDSAGNVYVADTGDGRVRLLTPQAANLSITSTHTGDFAQNQIGATYTVTVSNAPSAGPTYGLVTVTDALPDGLTLVSMAGLDWNCFTNTCTRSDALMGGDSYPPITVTVNVTNAAATPLVNRVTVNGGGTIVRATDSTVVDQCLLTLGAGSASLPATGTANPATCPDPAQGSCGFLPETPLNFTVMASAACEPWVATSSNPAFLQIVSGAGGSGNGAVSFTALANVQTSSRSASLTVTSGPYSAVYSVTEAGATDNLAYRQLYTLYEQFLGRDPDQSGFAFWSGLTGANLGQIADAFLTSPESFDHSFAVLAAYQAAWGAPPTYAEFMASVMAVRAGGSVGGLFTSLLGSGYTATNLYQNLLNRQPLASEISSANAAGLASWFQTLIGYPAGTTTAAANNEFQSTGTFQTDYTNGLYIRLLYFLVLDRDPDAAGLNFWVGVANAGGPGIFFQGAAGLNTRLSILGTGAPSEGFLGSSQFQGLFAN